MRRLQSLLSRFVIHAVSFKVLAGLIIGIAAGPARAGGEALVLDLTLPTVYNNNFGASRTDRVDGLNLTPAAQLTLDGKITNSLTYKAYGSLEIDRFDKGNIEPGFASDTPQASFGLTYAHSDWKFGASYLGQWVYAPTFPTFNARYDDFIFTVKSPTVPLGFAGKFDTVVGYRERHSTDTISSHHSPYIRLSWTKPLEGIAQGWTSSADFTFRYLEYDQGRATTAKDLVTAQKFVLDRDLVKNLNLALLAIHTNRDSNILERHFDQWTVGATLTLTFDIIKP